MVARDEQPWDLGKSLHNLEEVAPICSRASQVPQAQHFSQEIGEAAEAKATRIVEEELNRLGWTEETLAQRRKGEPAKVRIALRLRRETAMTLGWAAGRLAMGTKTHFAHWLYWNENR